MVTNGKERIKTIQVKLRHKTASLIRILNIAKVKI